MTADAQQRYRWRAEPTLAPQHAQLREGVGTLVFRFDPRSAFTLDVMTLSRWLELERVELVELIGGNAPTLLERLAPAPDRSMSGSRWDWLTTEPRPRVEPGQRLEVTCRLRERISPGVQRCSVLLEGTALLPPAAREVMQIQHVDQSLLSAGEWSRAAGLGSAPDVVEQQAFIRAVVALTTAQRALLSLELGGSSRSVEQDTATAVEHAERAWLVLQGKGYA